MQKNASLVQTTTPEITGELERKDRATRKTMGHDEMEEANDEEEKRTARTTVRTRERATWREQGWE